MKSKELRAKRAKLIEDARALTTGDTIQPSKRLSLMP